MQFWEFPLKFWQYFQFVGTLSVLIGGATIWLMLREARSFGRLSALGGIATVALVVWLSVHAFDYGSLVFGLGWIVFGTALLICVESRDRVSAMLLIGCVLAWHLASLNSSAVSDIRARPSEVALQAAEIQRKETSEERSELATSIESEINLTPSEDAPPDPDAAVPDKREQPDSGDETSGTRESPEEDTPPSEPGDSDLDGFGDLEGSNGEASTETDEDSELAYRSRGKVERADGKRVEDADLTDAAENAKSIDRTRELQGLQAAVTDDIRMMEEDDVYRAQAWDRMNLFVVRLLFLVVIAWVVLDYLRQFNVSQSPVFPLPIAGRFVDAVAPKDHATWLVANERSQVRDLLELSVRKGETFLCFSESEPCQTQALPRTTPRLISILAFGLVLSLVIGGSLTRYGVAADWRRFYVGSLEDSPLITLVVSVAVLGFIPVAAQVPVLQRSLRRLRFDEDDEVPGSEFVLESLWFDRYCFTVEGESTSKGVLQDLVDFLEMRTIPDASVRQSVNVVWHFNDTPDELTLKQILFFIRKTNFRLVISSQEVPEEHLQAMFDEVVKAEEPEVVVESVETPGSGSAS